jgi:CHAT domain-containing protein
MRLIIVLLLVNSVSVYGQQEIWTKKADRASSLGRYDSVEYYCSKLSDSYTAKGDWHNFLSTTIFRAKNLIAWGNYPSAIEMARVVEKESEQHLGFMNYYQGMAFQLIGDAELKSGNYQQAIDQFFEAELILAKDPGWKASLAGVLLSKGNAFRDRGSYSQAIENFNRGRELFKVANDELNAMICQLSVAGCLVMQEKYEEAIVDFEAGKDFLIKKLGDSHPYLAAIYNNLGAAILYQGKNYPLALQYFSKATDLKRKQSGGDYNVDVARGVFNTAWTQGEMKLWSDAEENFVRAETILKTIFPNGHPLAAWAFNRHGELMVKQKKYEQAIPLFGEAVKQNTRNVKGQEFFLDKVRATETFRFESSAYYEWYKTSRNIEYLKRALQNILESQQTSLKLGQETQKEADRLEMSKIVRAVFETGAEVCYELYRTTGEKHYLSQFFQFSETGKALVLNQALAESQALKFAGVPDSLVAKDREFRQYADDFTQKLVAFDAAKQPSSDLKTLEDALYKLSEIKRFFEQGVEKNYPKYFELKYKSGTASLEGLQKVIPKGTVVMTYMVTDSLLFVTTITQQAIDVTPVCVKPKVLERMVNGMRSGIVVQQRETFVKASAQLYQWLFPKGIPAASENIVVIPDSRLVKIPFETLLEKTPESADAYARMDFLINRVSLSYASSAQLFVNRMAGKPKSGEGLLAMAPVFEEGITNPMHLRTQSWLNETDHALKASGETRGTVFNGNAIMPLPATADEIQSLYKLFANSKKPAELMLGPVANERKLKSVRLENYQFIHLATHGFVNEESPELSGLLLAQDTSEFDEDNVLYMGELYNLRLNADLVTLSACETGLGKIIQGEGVVGLTRALTYAGARNILVSLWKVNDASTAALMISFYKTLLQNNQTQISSALRDAKLAMIKDEKFSDPYYWSPFVLTGW